jgi:hypothetical protein
MCKRDINILIDQHTKNEVIVLFSAQILSIGFIIYLFICRVGGVQFKPPGWLDGDDQGCCHHHSPPNQYHKTGCHQRSQVKTANSQVQCQIWNTNHIICTGLPYNKDGMKFWPLSNQVGPDDK